MFQDKAQTAENGLSFSREYQEGRGLIPILCLQAFNSIELRQIMSHQRSMAGHRSSSNQNIIRPYGCAFFFQLSPNGSGCLCIIG